jgi:hypothetical protein
VRQLIIALAIATCAATAHADDMADMAMPSDAAASSHVDAHVALVAASYQQMSFGGDYEGVVPELMWSHGRYMIGGSLGLYRIFENGRDAYGPGDLMLHGSIALVDRDTVRAGLMLAGTVPTGNMYQGFGMGGPTLMPSAWASWTVRRITLSATGGWGGMLEGGMGDHMMMTIVAPMNESELEWSAALDVPIAHGVHGGLLGEGGIPVGEPGVDRVIGAVRLAWGQGRVDTGAELQAGIAGDPFRIRGLVETALHF